MSNLKCDKHGKRVHVVNSTFRNITTVTHRSGSYDRCDSKTFKIGDKSYTAAQIVSKHL